MRSLLFLLLPFFARAQNDTLPGKIFDTVTDPVFREVITHPDNYRLQIIYTQIDRDEKNRPHFTHYYFHYDPDLYFNPASMVKLPLAALALEKLHELPGVSRITTALFDSSRPWQHPLLQDTTAASGLPSIGHFIKRALLVSENDPYNRLYQFVGQQRINSRLHEMGFADVRITRQFLGLTPEQNRHTNALRFTDKKGRLIYAQPAAYNPDSFRLPAPILIGKAHLDRRDSLIQLPFDFTLHNNLSLGSLQGILQAVLFPDAVPPAARFRLRKEDYAFLLRYLSQTPSETPDPKYDTARFYDSYVKFFFRDSTRRLPDGVRVFNKVGWSYGFLTDVSYVADFRNKVEFMLSATLYVNKDEIINDGKYEYGSVGWPFLYQLGQAVYHYERTRPRRHRPDLSAFRLRYEKRNPRDRRPSLVDVDN